MRYTVYNKAMKRPVFQTNDLEEANDYTHVAAQESQDDTAYTMTTKTLI